MRWWIDSSKLSPDQENIISEIRNNPNNNYWIRGFAGTGKTIVLLHTMEQLSALYPDAKFCYITYTNSLVELVYSSPGFKNLKDSVSVQTYYTFLSNKIVYDYVFLDEVQDVSTGKLQEIKNFSRFLVIAGDLDQQIYSDCLDYDEILSVLNPIQFDLLRIHRLTERLCNFSFTILPEAKDNIVSGLKVRNTNANATITLAHAKNETEEVAWVWDEARTRSQIGDPSALLFTTHDDLYRFANYVCTLNSVNSPPRPQLYRGRRNYGKFNEYFCANNIPIRYLGGKSGTLGDSDSQRIIYLMTFYSSKGLDFDNVFIPFMTPKTVFLSKNKSELDGRRLLFVGVTRSRQKLFISYSGNELHPYFNQAKTFPDLMQISIDTTNNSDDDGDLF